MAPDRKRRAFLSASPMQERHLQLPQLPLLLFSAILHGGMDRTYPRNAITACVCALPVSEAQLNTHRYLNGALLPLTFFGAGQWLLFR